MKMKPILILSFISVSFANAQVSSAANIRFASCKTYTGSGVSFNFVLNNTHKAEALEIVFSDRAGNRTGNVVANFSDYGPTYYREGKVLSMPLKPTAMNGYVEYNCSGQNSSYLVKSKGFFVKNVVLQAVGLPSFHIPSPDLLLGQAGEVDIDPGAGSGYSPIPLSSCSRQDKVFKEYAWNQVD